MRKRDDAKKIQSHDNCGIPCMLYTLKNLLTITNMNCQNYSIQAICKGYVPSSGLLHK